MVRRGEMNGKITQNETKRGITCLGVRAENDG
jgi:hypothetical protein